MEVTENQLAFIKLIMDETNRRRENEGHPPLASLSETLDYIFENYALEFGV